MDVALSSAQWPKSRCDFDRDGDFFEAPSVFVSTADVSCMLKSKKFTYIELGEVDEERAALLKTAWLGVCLLCVSLAMATFIEFSNRYSFIDHSADRALPYTCINETNWCASHRSGSYKSYVDADGYWIDHTKDARILDVEASLKPFLSIALIPPACLYIAYKVAQGFFKYSVKLKNKAIEEESLHFSRIQALLYEALTIDEAVPASSHSVAQLAELTCKKHSGYTLSFLQNKTIKRVHPFFFEELSSSQADEKFKWTESFCKRLSFLQIKAIKELQSSFFEELLGTEALSQQQTEYWHKISLMQTASLSALADILSSDYYTELFIAEPYFLECLIQYLHPSKLTDEIVSLLVRNMKALSTYLSEVPTGTLTKAVKLISAHKYSLVLALQHVAFEKTTETIALSFSNSVQLRVSKAVLAHFSPVFSGLFQDVKDDVDAAIHLVDLDASAFEGALKFLQSGQLPGGQKNLALLPVAERYDFSALKQAIEIDLCHRLEDLCKDNSIEFLLELCENYNLLQFAQAIDMQFVARLRGTAEKCIENLLKDFALAVRGNLQNTQQQLSKIFKEHLLKFSLRSNFCFLLIHTIDHNKTLAKKLFAVVCPLFEKNPALLKGLWDMSQEQSCYPMQACIVDFCQTDADYTYLACWPMIPANLQELIIES